MRKNSLFNSLFVLVQLEAAESSTVFSRGNVSAI